MLYVSETKHALAAENPDLDTMEVRKMAISNFKKLTPEEREVSIVSIIFRGSFFSIRRGIVGVAWILDLMGL